MADIIATEQDVYDLGGRFKDGRTLDTKRCTTKDKCIEMQMAVTGSYSGNQLVCKKDVSRYTVTCNWIALLSYYILTGSSNWVAPRIKFTMTAYDKVTGLTIDKSYEGGNLYGNSNIGVPYQNLPDGVTLRLEVLEGPFAVYNGCYVYGTSDNRPVINSQYGSHGRMRMWCTFAGQSFYGESVLFT